ncbi:putative membrane protein YphA (DoxX/SURF4 family) [Bacillus niacini]|uniref:Membrane protein YphA (DoxX/SURF4 family) n=1 Tax=Neobacillus niacini TaxID=86668 RepID=A0A852T8P3_9BACI|nr:DoxX family protein [Neobacillus niacini]NYE04185.1 putative membrane protein YphA (DoxX/SURF4 family) [Neobacillus niacini]
MEILTYVLQGILALMFLMAGFGKVTGSKMHVEAFTHWKLPQWFRVVTGLVELAGAVLLIVGYWYSTSAMAGSLLLGITGVGGIITHIRVKDSFKDTSMILFLAILSFVVLYLYLA